jgi:thiamine biosynthesis lipoprotein
VVVTDASMLAGARAAIERELSHVDLACSRFRPDSELTRVNDAAGNPVRVGWLLYEAVEVALRAALLTDGLVDPTIGASLEVAGYDRDLEAIPQDGPVLRPLPAAGWRKVRLDPVRRTVELPEGARLDLGATAKALAADRAAAAARADTGAAVLVSLGGDIAVSGVAPPGGWAVAVADDHRDGGDAVFALHGGGLATSSTTVRRWRRGGREVHHILDPATGAPAPVVWRTASVAAASCVDANIASTAAILLGERAPDWLEAAGLPARLVDAGGGIVAVAGWSSEVAA